MAIVVNVSTPTSLPNCHLKLSNKIVKGDFNTVVIIQIALLGRCPVALKHLNTDMLGLNDAWVNKNKNKNKYTWHHPWGTKLKSRIDLIFVSQIFTSTIKAYVIFLTLNSDHSDVIMFLDINVRGQGY